MNQFHHRAATMNFVESEIAFLVKTVCSPVLAICIFLFATTSLATSHSSTVSLDEQRQHYADARLALKQGKIKTFKNHIQELDGYPLKSYLEYDELRRRLYLLPYEDVDQFLDAHTDSYVGDKLNSRWLSTLYKKKRWHDYQTYYISYSNSKSRTVQRCQYLLARLYSGDKTSLRDVEPLWNVGKSQPDECDPLFSAWMEAGYLTDDVAWNRFHKAIGNRQITLARYILRRIPKDLEPLASLYLEVDRYPHRIKKPQRFKFKTGPENTLYNQRMETIIHHGLQRYARRDTEGAVDIWEQYDDTFNFQADLRQNTQQYILSRLALRGELDLGQSLLKTLPEISDPVLAEWLVRDALRHQDWQLVFNTLQLLSDEQQQTERWLYWRARALEHLQIADPNFPTPRQIFSSLALTRDFYGFLSADKIGQNYSLADKPIMSEAAVINSIELRPSFQRAKELLAIDEINYARREWRYATLGMTEEELLASAKVANQWGWHRKTIQALADARYWDDIELRFPLAHQPIFSQAAAKIQEPEAFLFAIARQESAFASDARSPAGAMGLMQLMPATARQTAKQIGVTYRYWDLIKPENNIQLGSSYLEHLLTEFNGNRILATAAYNAGPNRVKQWIDDPTMQMPFDIWIETIPFKETRGYVQNVLYYSVIYNHRLGQESQMLPKLKDGTQIVGLQP